MGEPNEEDMQKAILMHAKVFLRIYILFLQHFGNDEKAKDLAERFFRSYLYGICRSNTDAQRDAAAKAISNFIFWGGEDR